MKHLHLFIVLISIDQLTKWLAIQNGLAHANLGMSFSFLSNQMAWLLLALSGAAVVGIFYLFYKQFPQLTAIVLAGGVSNMIDRFFRAVIVDWMAIPFTDLKNNFADWYIAVGLAGILFAVLRQRRAL